jgi:hypothetical protein
MLILKAYINDKQIDEIHIHNKGGMKGEFFKEDYCEYAIVKPKGIEQKFYHKRPLGYSPLARQVLRHLEEVNRRD